MRKIWIVFSVIIVFLIFQGCGSEKTYWQNWEAPNWTSDGKIVFLEDDGEQKINSWGDMVGGNQTLTLYEIDEDGNNLQQTGEIVSCSFESGRVLVPISTSSAGDWVILSIEDWRRGDHYPVMYTIKRNGDSLSEIGSGKYPDFSPDASQIVYEKPDEGIWIMDSDGGNDHQIISDADAKYPAWSSDDTLIAYGEWNTRIITTTGDSLKTYNRHRKPDWGPQGSNLIVAASYYGYPVITDISTNESDTLDYFQSGYGIKWSPDSIWLCSETSQGILVIGIDGTNSHYIAP